MTGADKSTSLRPAAKTDAGQGGVPVWVGWVLLVVAGMVIAGQIRQSSNRPLTPLETALFNGLTVVIGLVGSVVVSGYYWRKQSSRDVANARENYQQLARPAWRRVVSIETSLERIRSSVAEHAARLAADPEGKVIGPQAQSQWVDGLRRQVEHVGDHITAAIADWRELLPEDFAALIEEQAQIDAAFAELADRRERMEELERELREKDDLVASLAADQGQAVKASAQEVEAAKAEAEQLRADLENERRRYRQLADGVTGSSGSRLARAASTTEAGAAWVREFNSQPREFKLTPRAMQKYERALEDFLAQGLPMSAARDAAAAAVAPALHELSADLLTARKVQARASTDRRDDQEAERRGLAPDTEEAR